jgi:hypothetical protein
VLDDFELAGRQRQAIEENRVEYDPTDGEQPEARAKPGRGQRGIERHFIGEDSRSQSCQ